MFRFIKWFFTGDGHIHKWKIIADGPIANNGTRTGTYYDCQCEICGKIKFVRK